jgi:hypothetical protein
MIVGSEAAGNASSSIRNPLSPSRLVCLADPAFRGGERVPDALFKMFWWHRGHQLRVKNPLALFIYSQFERKRMLEPVSSRAKKIDEPELVTVIMEGIIAQTTALISPLRNSSGYLRKRGSLVTPSSLRQTPASRSLIRC